MDRFVFTATTGRSGTKTLARLFSAVPGCVALHEPYPIMNGAILQAAATGDAALVERAYRQVKSINILRSALGQRYYVEANHLFVKTFIGQVIEDFGARMAIVHLVRPPIEVAMSIFRLQDPPGTPQGNEWWLDYRAPANLIRIADVLDADPQFSHPFHKALWYWHEVEARIGQWRARRPEVHWLRFETGWFNDADRVFALLDELGMACERPAIAALVGTREHAREFHKEREALPEDEAQEMLARFRTLLAGRGISVP